ncbi:MAG: glycosyltransferase family 87 protein [Corynebacterium sp.]|nr:glycosyltransferase family 87 protein [Corynebacterium sp.]
MTQSRQFRLFLSIAAYILALFPLVERFRKAFDPNNMVDLSVFQDAAFAVMHSQPLFGPDFVVHSQSPFVYPPFAALVFLPLSFLPLLPLKFLCLLSFYAVAILLIWWVLRSYEKTWLLPFVLLAAVYTAPFQTTAELGQIDLLLYGLIVADALGLLPRRLRGVGIGIAAAIKMTPAVFGVIFLFRRDWAAAIRSAVTFAITVVIGFIFLPADSKYFWLKLAFDSTRAVAPNYSHDMSIRGLLTKSILNFDQADAIKSILFVLGFSFAIFLAYRAWRHYDAVLSMLVLFLGLMLFQPVANFHHWTAGTFVFAMAFSRHYKSWINWGLWVLSLGFTLSWLLPQLFFRIPQATYSLDPAAWYIHNILGLCAIVAFILLAIGLMNKKVPVIAAAALLTACTPSPGDRILSDNHMHEVVSIPEVNIEVESCILTNSYEVKPGYNKPEEGRYALLDARFTSTSETQSYNPVRYLIGQLIDNNGIPHTQLPLNAVAGNPSVDSEDNLNPGGTTTMRYVFKLHDDEWPVNILISDQWYDFHAWAKIQIKCTPDPTQPDHRPDF